MPDCITNIGRSLVQHGHNSNRVYLMKLAPDDLPGIVELLNELATQEGYTKIFAKVPEPFSSDFLADGYVREGSIPGFFCGETDALFLGKYFHRDRLQCPDRAEIDRVISLALRKRGEPAGILMDRYTLREADADDAGRLAALYGSIFDSYPFPVHDSQYIAETQKDNVRYFIAECGDELAAAASCEMDPENRNVEMTDFATKEKHRGNRLSVHLLKFMEKAMREAGMQTLYTIARAVSPGMNITFARCGYAYGGTLVNNTQIAGSIESMNLWYKPNIK